MSLLSEITELLKDARAALALYDSPHYIGGRDQASVEQRIDALLARLEALGARHEDAEWLRSIKPFPITVNGYMQQPGRKYWEMTSSDIDRLRRVADALELLRAENEKLKDEKRQFVALLKDATYAWANILTINEALAATWRENRNKLLRESP